MNPAIKILLRKTEPTDLEKLFEFQLDQEANYLAAFTPKDPTDKAAYMEKWLKIVSNPTINMQTIIADGNILGSVIKFELKGQAETSYWLDKKYWGKGIVTQALKQFVATEPARPLMGVVAFDNIGSQRVLEKCGYRRIGTDKGFANARNEEIEEFVYRLD